MGKSRMFPFITDTYNPIGGVCPFCCAYCWAKAVIKRYVHKKYAGKYYIVEGALTKKFKAGSFVFICDMLDLFAPNVPKEIILKVLEIPKNNPESKFLLLTKNPRRFHEFADVFPKNVVLGATIESDRNYPDISKALPQISRLGSMIDLASYTKKFPLFLSVEPIMGFSLERFVCLIETIKPWAVAVGYDNYNNKLPEPALNKTENFIARLGVFTTVYRKTIKKAWWEK